MNPATRVLLLGAYASGNVGDGGQAAALADEILALRPDAAIDAVAPGQAATWGAARNYRVLPGEAGLDHRVLNSYDLVLVGGGGLLSTGWLPLSDAAWVSGIETRLCAISLGCEARGVDAAEAFVRRCDRFSVRDERSAGYAGRIRDDLELVLDPMLLAIGSEGNPRLDPRGGTPGCIPGKLMAATEPFYEVVQSTVLDEHAGTVLSLYWTVDERSGFEDFFIVPVTRAAGEPDVRAWMARRSFVLSERLHGCALALKWGIPCFGLALRSAAVTSKITDLYGRLGIGDHVLRSAEDADFTRLHGIARSEFDSDAVLSRMGAERLHLRHFLAECLSSS